MKKIITLAFLLFIVSNNSWGAAAYCGIYNASSNSKQITITTTAVAFNFTLDRYTRFSTSIENSDGKVIASCDDLFEIEKSEVCGISVSNPDFLDEECW